MRYNVYMKKESLGGKTRHYKGNGRKFGYPTANIDITTSLDDGVYFGFANLSNYKHHPALIFIGTPTTVGDKERRIEAHLLDIVDQDYYDEELKLTIEYFHRPNQKFESIDKLLKVMKQDEQTGRAWFKAHELASKD